MAASTAPSPPRPVLAHVARRVLAAPPRCGTFSSMTTKRKSTMMAPA